MFYVDSTSVEFVVGDVISTRHYDGRRRRSPWWWGWAETRIAVVEKQVSASLICRFYVIHFAAFFS